MTAKKTAAKQPADMTDAELEAAIEDAASVTVYHPDARLGRSRKVPADSVARWQKQGWLTKEDRDSSN